MTAVATELDILESLDFEHEIMCEEVMGIECAHPGQPRRAMWWSIALCCGRPPVPFCDSCKALDETKDERYHLIHCIHCHAIWYSGQPPQRRYVPITSRS